MKYTAGELGLLTARVNCARFLEVGLFMLFLKQKAGHCTAIAKSKVLCKNSMMFRGIMVTTFIHDA